ncbi:MAG TPA: response regulator [Phenylobacterium sp.]|uniref:response regulator n=1 Tax=Phenylobacterium sp. TaxID=1871053 RepID=UPI002D2D2840|nr:response regulator [Phenylobacterium sp.]HZZ66669.1 response regulator [Phenylobacterium sp.]
MAVGIEARRLAAGVRSSAAELALAAFTVGGLGLVVAPQVHGASLAMVVAATVAVTVFAAMGLARTRRGAERTERAEAAVAEASEAIDRAAAATRGVLDALRDEVAPPLGKMLAAAKAMASDRRLSASVRGRLKALGAASEQAVAVLDEIVTAPNEAAAAVDMPPLQIAGPVDGKVKVRVAANAPVEAVVEADIEIEAPAEPQFEPQPFDVTPAFQPVRPLRVLVGEHNGVHQLLLRTLLAQADIAPEIVADGALVIEAWRREPWDLILLDAQMPDIDGAALARMIRSVETKFRWPATPIVALASHPTAADLEAFADAGMSGHLTKPIAGLELMAAIDTALATPIPELDVEEPAFVFAAVA